MMVETRWKQLRKQLNITHRCISFHLPSQLKMMLRAVLNWPCNCALDILQSGSTVATHPDRVRHYHPSPWKLHLLTLLLLISMTLCICSYTQVTAKVA